MCARRCRYVNRQEAEDYIYSSYMRAQPQLSYDMPDSVKRHPEFTKKIIQSLYRGTPSIAVTGSKGKGSVAYILSSVLSLCGKTGLMTGPHTVKFNERFRIADELISDDEFSLIVSELRTLFDEIGCDTRKGEFISPIGIETAVAEAFFGRHGTDYDIYEHGKGVRYDDVGNIPAGYGIINTIFLEHTRELGGSIEEIASDKACIIRSGMKGIYSGRQSREAADIIIKRAENEGVELKLFGRDYSVSDIKYLDEGMSCTVETSGHLYRDIKISLMGSVQCHNLALALQAAEDIIGADFMRRKEDMQRLQSCLQRLEWFGRLSVLSRDPFILTDCCINRNSTASAIEAVRELDIRDPLFILAIPDDKDYPGVAEAVNKEGYDIVLSEVSNPHYRFSGIQQKKLSDAGIVCGYEKDLIKAVSMTGRPVVILGTTAMLPELKRRYR